MAVHQHTGEFLSKELHKERNTTAALVQTEVQSVCNSRRYFLREWMHIILKRHPLPQRR